mgnify:FL=1
MSLSNIDYSVLQVLPHLDSGGLVNGAVEISRTLSNNNLGSYITTSGGRRLHEVTRFGTEVIIAPVHSKNPVTIYRNISKIKKIIKNNNIDIIHARSRSPAWSSQYAAKKMKIPFITTFHGTYGIENMIKKKYNGAMINADKIIAISNFIAGHIKREYKVIKEKIVVIPRGVDLSIFDSARVREQRLIDISNKFDLKEENHTILLPARMTRWKGHNLLIEAVKKLKRNDIICLFVGDVQTKKQYVKELESKIKKMGLTNNFRFLGAQQDMPAIFKLADVVISASTKPEAFGRVVAESLAMGRPTISVNHGGGAEIIRDKMTGWLFKSGNVNDLCKKISMALDLNKGQRLILSEKCIQNIKENYDIKFMCDRTLKLYSELVKENKKYL